MRMLRVIKLCRRDVRQALGYTRNWFQARGFGAAATALLALILVGALHHLDEVAANASATLQQSIPVSKVLARNLSYFGDFLGFNVTLFVGLQVAGWSLRSRRLVRLAVASLLCACLAGAMANVTRTIVGRPRPSTAMTDGLYGPSLDGSMHSLPSAHTATAFGAALPVLMSEPLIGTPLTVFAAGVSWSRVHLERHHVTDIFVSMILAAVFSVPLSRWALQRAVPARRKVLSPSSAKEPHPLIASGRTN